jgi:hypothetical protein
MASDGNSSCGQLTLNFDPAMHERFPTLRAFIAHRAAVVPKHLKVQAADMDMAPSTLSRKLNPTEGDTQRFNCDDLEAWLDSTGDAAAVVEYLASKFMDTDEARRARALSKLERLLPELAALGALVSEARRAAA